MASNYSAIREENRGRYGTDIGRIGPMLLADRYDDRTHFIFELLQNAEDALKRREKESGPRGVKFHLSPKELTLSHFGRPFDLSDVRGVCGIAQSTKDDTSIGRFGIGFKSVYTFTDHPEIHSGDEDFFVENYVEPKEAQERARSTGETVIVLPLKSDDTTAGQDITIGFQRLGASALLFLRNIEEIAWSVAGGASGVYLRSSPEILGPNVERITVIGQEEGKDEIDQTWLVFHREISNSDGKSLGRVEVAFFLEQSEDFVESWTVQPVGESPLVVFFPTVVTTHLGFLVQGPYRTTPSRDNVPRNDPWNQHLVRETSVLVVEAMRWLRDSKMLDVRALRCLPIERDRFPDGSMFAPLFEAVRNAFLAEKLLLTFDSEYVAAHQAKLARTQDLRELFSPVQVAALFQSEASAWLSGDITQDRAAEVRQYLMRELGVGEVTPATLLPRLNETFLEEQSDEWIQRLYEFLDGQEAALRRRLDTAPLVRLSSGKHVTAMKDGRPNAFLPSGVATEFPIVRLDVCRSPDARKFLLSLGITEPDPVDDVVWNVLPKYRMDSVDVGDEQYSSDIERILKAFATDSKSQREKLLSALRGTSFVMVVDSGDGVAFVSPPGDVYLATERLKLLFKGVADVLIVDDNYACLRGENVRELLEACGALRYPRPIESPSELKQSERLALREAAGHSITSGVSDRIVDWTLQGFEDLIKLLPSLEPEDCIQRAKALWESLGDLEERRGRGIFEGTYTWTHYGSYKKDFPAAFIRRLRVEAWVPDANCHLQPPSLVIFDQLGWKANPFLLSQIEFKPPILDELARAAGIDPETLALLRKLGITNVADLAARLGMSELDGPSDPPDSHDAGAEVEGQDDDVYEGASDLYGEDMPEIPGEDFDEESEDSSSEATQGSGGQSSGAASSRQGSRHSGTGQTRTSSRNGQPGNGRNQSRSSGDASQKSNREFVSYMSAHAKEVDSDPDGLEQAERMKIEKSAIDLIIELEPSLQRTAAGNAGFDLYEFGDGANVKRWVEVKAMTGDLNDRPIALSKPQFEFAHAKGQAYWLYIVEHASDRDLARVLRIQNPVGRTQHLTFDKGWQLVAEIDVAATINI